MEKSTSYGTVSFGKVIRALDTIEKKYQGAPEDLNNVEVSFEFLIGSFFPEIIKNITAEVNKQYTLGYLAGIKKGKEENDN